MKRALLADEMRALDRAADEAYGMPPGVLMENAGAALAAEASRRAAPGGRFWVLCGRGNNGGDGLVAARHLRAAGQTVRVELMVPPGELEGDPKLKLKALEASGVIPSPIARDEVAAGDVVVDALLGTGLNRAPAGPYAEAIERIAAWRAAGARVVAADIPSGLPSDGGAPFEPCVSADATVAFAYAKVGEVVTPGAGRCGELVVVDIGIPPAAEGALKGPGVHLVQEGDARGRLPMRGLDAHKGTFGHVLLVAGSWGKTGAAALAAAGALRAGAGLVTVATRPEALVPVMAHAPEVMGVELIADGGLGLSDLNSLLEAAEGKDAVVIGPGIPRGPDTGKLLGAFLEELSVPCVLDADGLNALAGQLDVLAEAKGPLLLTPHPGEMSRLLGKPVKEIQANRVEAARALATTRRAVVALKGARTVIARPDGEVFVNPTGNPGMATGGVGDVLAGVCGALAAQGLTTFDAALVGVFAHGLAGDLAVRRTGQLGLIAGDLLAALGEVWVRWER